MIEFVNQAIDARGRFVWCIVHANGWCIEITDGYELGGWHVTRVENIEPRSARTIDAQWHFDDLSEAAAFAARRVMALIRKAERSVLAGYRSQGETKLDRTMAGCDYPAGRENLAYSYPIELLTLQGFEDSSYGNDACGSVRFSVSGQDYVLYVDHETPGEREDEGPRFTMWPWSTDDEQPDYDGDSASFEAPSALVAHLLTLGAWS